VRPARCGTLLFLGTGATPPPSGRKNTAMLLQYGEVAILFDSRPDLSVAELPVRPQAIFLTDRDAAFVRAARRMAAALAVPLEPAGRLTAPLLIEARRVVHTRTHPTYVYRIQAETTVVYAPEFFRLPRKLLRRVDLAILDGATWGRDILFVGRSGGHRDAAYSAHAAQALGVRRVYLTHIGTRTEARAPEALKLYDGQVLRF
jgi:ribonuclease BN (tRNA processing enzyme)